MLEGGATHVGVATDHVIESFRNALWAGYKTGDGIDPLLLAQFEPLEDALRALGVVVGHGRVRGRRRAGRGGSDGRARPRVEQVVVCTPDKDLSQCVRGTRVVQLDRRTREVRDEEGVRRKFGLSPASIPDWLALVGDSADGYPGLPGWGAKSASAVLAATSISSASPHGPRNGTFRSAERRSWRRRSPSSASARSCSAPSPSFVRTPRSASTWTGCDGWDRAPTSQRGRPDWARPRFTSAPRHWRPRARLQRAEHCGRVSVHGRLTDLFADRYDAGYGEL
jgi:hypothetical protein